MRHKSVNPLGGVDKILVAHDRRYNGSVGYSVAMLSLMSRSSRSSDSKMGSGIYTYQSVLLILDFWLHFGIVEIVSKWRTD